MAVSSAENFLQRTRAARKVMVLDLGFLGDTVHLLPALWMVRQAYPQAELHVAVAAHVTSLMDSVPWVNKTWGYMRYPRHATLKENWEMVSRLRREKFDVVINLNGSDRSSWLTFLSGARERLGRLPGDGGPPFWKRMFTAHVHYPFGQEPVYLQRCRCLEQAGFLFTQPEFHAEIDPANLRAADIAPADAGTYFHLSPFTTADYKELSPRQYAEFITALQTKFPDKKCVLSCAPTEREKGKMAALLPLLPREPWRVLAGNLTLTQLAAVIQHSALHFCGDTGTLHLAVMTNTPTVAWFWPNPGRREWLPTGNHVRVIVGTNEPGAQFLENVATDELVAATQLPFNIESAMKQNPKFMGAPVNPADVEKQLVWKFFGQKAGGTFVEVGANDPVAGSQTWLLEQNGWRGVLVEPQSAHCEKLRQQRKNSKVFQAACSSPANEGEMDLMIAAHDGASTLQPQRDTHGIRFVGTERVKVTTLDRVLNEARVEKVDFLSLDVEGHEIEVMRGLDFDRFKPALILIEDGVRDLSKHRFLKSRGYKLVKRTSLNNWYVPRECAFHMTSLPEKMELLRKMYLALPLRKIRLYLRHRRANAKG